MAEAKIEEQKSDEAPPAVAAAPIPRSLWREDAVWLTLAFAAALHLGVGMRWPNEIWQDEIFQVLEQAHRLAYGYGVVPWEYRTGIRSWLSPGVLALVMSLAPGGSGSAGPLFMVQVALALMSLAPVATAIAWARRLGVRAAWVAGVACAVWFELVFFSSKALTEVFAGHALAPALYWVFLSKSSNERRPLLVAGALLGLAVGLRFHLAPAAVVALVWANHRELWRWKWTVAGFSAVLLAFGVLDAVTWSLPFQSILLNFWINVVEGKARSFGASPPYEYVVSALLIWGWSALPLLGFGALALRRVPLLGWVGLAILIGHSTIAHKEYRFLFPLWTLLALGAAVGVALLLQSNRRVGLVALGVFLLASADGARRYDRRDFAPRSDSAEIAEFHSAWTFRRGQLLAAQEAGLAPDLCGLGLMNMGWGDTGGYTWLHRDVPLVELGRNSWAERHRIVNYAIAPEGFGRAHPFVIVRCLDGTCLYRRPGPCENPKRYSLNQELADTGM